MTHFALLFLVLTIPIPNVFAGSAGQTADEQGVRATVADYIEGYYTRDVARMEKSLHPHYLKHTVSNSDGGLRMTETNGRQLLEQVRSAGPAEATASQQKEEITVLDIAGDVASAKLVTAHWTDYMTLVKSDGGWKIVSVVLREND